MGHKTEAIRPEVLVVPLSLIPRIGLVATGAFLLYTASGITTLAAITSHFFIVVSLLVYVLAFGLIVLAGVRREFRWTNGLILVATIVGIAALYCLVILKNPRNYIGDGLAVTQSSAEMVVKGQNPYSVHSSDVFMDSARKSGLAQFFVTRQPDGKVIDQLMVYPAGMFLVYVPPVALGLRDMRWLGALATLLSLVILWWQAPPILRPLACLPVVVSANLTFVNVVLGALDPIWLLVLMFCVIALNHRRFDAAALTFGLAIAIKQQPWLLIPFIAVWLWYESKELTPPGRTSRVARFFAIASGVFLLVNLPFIVWNFSDWFTGITWQFWSNQILISSGLASLTASGTLHLSKDVYTLFCVIAVVVLLAAYVRFYNNLKHAVWIFPGIVLWFGYRSFEHYFTYWVPLICLSIFFMLREGANAAGSAPVIDVPAAEPLDSAAALD